MDNNTRKLRNVIYRLKRRYRKSIEIWNKGSTTVNLETGEKDDNWSSYVISKAVVLPTESARDFVYDLAFIASNRNFTSGGIFDKIDATILLDSEDVVTLTTKSNIQFNSGRYEIKKIIDVLDERMKMVICVSLEGYPILVEE